MPSEKAPPEAKASAAPELAKTGDFLPALDLETARFAHVLSNLEAPLETPPGGTPASVPALPLSLRC
jgi:hypothetical protein